ncbi:unnamed protein product [Closterium sp. Naga37s-1]|nr:unnamed protein product [Closterium sp. Naga37s-1]
MVVNNSPLPTLYPPSPPFSPLPTLYPPSPPFSPLPALYPPSPPFSPLPPLYPPSPPFSPLPPLYPPSPPFSPLPPLYPPSPPFSPLPLPPSVLSTLPPGYLRLFTAMRQRTRCGRGRVPTPTLSISPIIHSPCSLSPISSYLLAFPFSSPYPSLPFSLQDAAEDESNIHIVDFAMWAGQWPIVIRQLAAAARKRMAAAAVTIKSHNSSSSSGIGIAVDPPFGHPYGTGPKLPAAFLQAELARAAQECGVSLSFSRVEAAPETLRAAAIGVERGECVLVNVAGRLACVADSTVLRHSPKDTAIKAIMQLDPKVVALVEWDSNQQQPFFLSRFRDALLFFHNIFTSHDALASRFSFGRRGFEEFVLAREMVNLVACEGMQRLVRAERLDQMHARMGRLGVAARPFSKRSMWGLRELIAPYPKGFAVERHPAGGVRLMWNGQSILGASAWTPGGGDERRMDR